MKIGYARVSTLEQNLDLQIDALKTAGCKKIFTDKISGKNKCRPALDEALAYARTGDVIVTWKLDRLGRSLKHLIEVVTDLEERSVGFTSIQENLDTTSAGGKLIFHIFGAFAEFESDIIRERTKAGLEAARARGRKGGRKKLLTEAQEKQLRVMAKDKSISVKEVCQTFGIARATYYKYLNQV
jgi:DNA invertase Pin-like site-specific DNA recombinase